MGAQTRPYPGRKRPVYHVESGKDWHLEALDVQNLACAPHDQHRWCVEDAKILSSKVRLLLALKGIAATAF